MFGELKPDPIEIDPAWVGQGDLSPQQFISAAQDLLGTTTMKASLSRSDPNLAVFKFKDSVDCCLFRLAMQKGIIATRAYGRPASILGILAQH
jgi:hypothetical protein